MSIINAQILMLIITKPKQKLANKICEWNRINLFSFFILRNRNLQNYFFFFIGSLRKNCPNTEFSLVHIFLYSVRLQENTDQRKLRMWALFTKWFFEEQNKITDLNLEVKLV